MLRKVWNRNDEKLHTEESREENMNTVDSVTDNLIEAILQGETYQAYHRELEKVKQVPGLKEQLDEFRRRNFELQSRADNDFEKLDCFEKEYQNFRDNPLVMDFLAAELDLCRLMQNVSLRITEALKFE